jgi:tetratricopeptide (TPR) repeat protein
VPAGARACAPRRRALAALLRAGQPEEGIRALRSAVRHGPGFALAHLNLGSALRSAGQGEEAVACFRRALALEPTLAAAHYNLGNALLASRQPLAAMPAFDAATRLAPGHFGAWFNRGHALKAVGRLDESAESYRQALRIDPASGQAWWALADHKGVRFSADEVACMEQLRGQAGLGAPAITALEFALARAWEDLGRDEEAFELLRSANRRQRQQVHYDAGAHEREVDRIVAWFDRDRLAGAAAAGVGDPGPIFVVSMPRSGSTLVDQILATHDEVTSTDEPDTLQRMVEALAPGQPSAWTEALGELEGRWASFGRRYLEQTRPQAGGRTRFTDKSLGNVALVGLIALALPQARVVLVARDPMDTCLSCYRQLFARGHEYSYDLQELGHRYRQYRRLMAHWREVLPGRVLDLGYEDLVDDLEGQARRLLSFCGLPWQPRCLDFHASDRMVLTASAAQVRKPLYRSAIGRWQRYAAQLQPLRAALQEAPPQRTP